MSNTLLTTVVLGRLGWELTAALGRDIAEELTNPLAQLGLVGAVGDNRDVLLGVGGGCKLADGLLVQVATEGSVESWVEGCSKTAVESNTVDGIGSDLSSVGICPLLVEVDRWVDLLEEFMC